MTGNLNRLFAKTKTETIGYVFEAEKITAVTGYGYLINPDPTTYSRYSVGLSW